MTMEVDYIIVGGGLMGSLMASELLLYKQRLYIFDSAHAPSASSVAAGLYNPITGQAMRKTSQADTLFPLLNTHYQALESQWNTQLLHPMPLYRPFASRQEQTRWTQHIHDPAYHPYASHLSTHPHPSGDLHDPYGGLHIHHAGFVDVPQLLRHAHRFFHTQGVLKRHAWVWDKCRLEKDSVGYEGLRAQAVISCEGIAIRENPFCQDLPLHPLKGEILDLATDKAPSTIYNRGVFMVPLAEGPVRVGATYEHVNTTTPSDKGRTLLLDKTKGLFKPKVHVLNHKAALRCCSQDRRPWVGAHPRHPALYICNGLGTKGVSWAPYACRALRAWLLEGRPIDPSIACTPQRLFK